MNEQRLNKEDYETLRQAQFTYDEQTRALDERLECLYTPENLKVVEPILREMIEEQRRKVFIALGLEENVDPDILY